MHLTSEQKKEIVKKYGKNENDTATPEVQIAMFTERISHLTTHLKAQRKDYSTQRALIRLVGKRRRLLNYLHDNALERYRSIVKALDLRK